jgi:hypothetical protein
MKGQSNAENKGEGENQDTNTKKVVEGEEHKRRVQGIRYEERQERAIENILMLCIVKTCSRKCKYFSSAPSSCQQPAAANLAFCARQP